MDEIELFETIKKMKKADVLSLLGSAHAEMATQQRDRVFGQLMVKTIKSKKTIDEDEVLYDVKEFYKASLSGHYYAPFNINSKNYMDIPEETDEWCSKMGLLWEESAQLTDLEKHDSAIECFKMLFELVKRCLLQIRGEANITSS